MADLLIAANPESDSRDVIADRSRYNRSQLVFTQARGRDVVFWQSPWQRANPHAST